jgi:hypothetical protein
MTYSVGVRQIKDPGTSTRSAKSAQEGVGRTGEGKKGGARAWKGKEKPASQNLMEFLIQRVITLYNSLLHAHTHTHTHTHTLMSSITTPRAVARQ